MRMVTAVRYSPVYLGSNCRVCFVGGFNMMKRLWVLAVGLLLAIISASSTFAQNNKEGSSMPKVGDVAPDFTLKHFDGNNLTDVKLSDYRGKKNVVLAFYVFAFTGG
jgi:cytochrome oxidase Cu insertion factor (SCO1/SenC/PrrC family)